MDCLIDDTVTNPAQNEDIVLLENAPPCKRARKGLSGSRATPFQKKHLLEYGLAVAARDPSTTEVVSVRCRFCVIFGRENNSKNCSTAWSFEGPPFRPENYRQHHVKNHPSKWVEYKSSSTKEKAEFFNVPEAEKYASKIECYLEPRSSSLRFCFHPDIVNVIIGELLLHIDDSGELQVQIEKIFTFNRESNEYFVEINQVKQFELAVRFVGRGMSFRMASDAIQDAKEVLSVAKLGFCNHSHVAKYARVICAASFQKIRDILKESWAFAVAFDGSTDLHGVSYIDVRIRYCNGSAIDNLHLIAVPFQGSHTGSAMFEMLVKLFDAVCPEWRSKLIGCSTDGAANMTGHLSGVVTRIQQAIKGQGFVRVWCLLHQIDIVLQKSFKSLSDGEFYQSLTSLVSHLRKQKLFSDRIQAVCPLLSATRWVSMSRVSEFLLRHRQEILSHFDRIGNERPEQIRFLPDLKWWILLAGVNDVSTQINIVVKKLQGRRLTLGNQQFELEQLAVSLKKRVFLQDPGESISLVSSDCSDIIVIDDWKLEKEQVLGFLQDQGIFVVQTLRQCSETDTNLLCMQTAKFLVSILQGLANITAIRDESNARLDIDHPPTLPHEIAALKPRQVANLVLEYHYRLSCTWDESRIHRIDEQHKHLLYAIEREQRLKSSIDKMTASTEFSEAWGSPGLKDRFPDLVQFLGGLACPFPNTATVESDFSVLKWEKDSHRNALTSFSLEGILHCRQFTQLLS